MFSSISRCSFSAAPFLFLSCRFTSCLSPFLMPLFSSSFSSSCTPFLVLSLVRSCADAFTPFALRSLAICGRVTAWTRRCRDWQTSIERPRHVLSVKMFTSRADFYRGINFSVREKLASRRVATCRLASRRRRPARVQARE